MQYIINLIRAYDQDVIIVRYQSALYTDQSFSLYAFYFYIV